MSKVKDSTRLGFGEAADYAKGEADAKACYVHVHDRVIDPAKLDSAATGVAILRHAWDTISRRLRTFS